MSAHRAPAASKRPPGRRGTPHEVRIIGGQWRRTKLPVADRPGLRPTPDRVRETLFNWLGQDLTGWRCVDAFAGSGALGFEAASRGAADVWLIEQDARLVAALAALKEKLHADAVRVQRGDGVGALARCAAASLDLVFLDPPFEAHDLLISALRAAARAVRSGGWIYLEAPQPIVAGVLAANGLDLHRRLKAGAVHAHVLTPIADRTA
ncbi:MAG: 16S rRNA (guanine(966)-N(2))-methyltransferase RsmD [Burkholderiaceae bacterium]|nr:MAG: 16S rRNA (guanine(966)-N(2))-methyltransferase RsmD [Burkholderiaceae bacterium]